MVMNLLTILQGWQRGTCLERIRECQIVWQFSSLLQLAIQSKRFKEATIPNILSNNQIPQAKLWLVYFFNFVNNRSLSTPATCNTLSMNIMQVSLESVVPSTCLYLKLLVSATSFKTKFLCHDLASLQSLQQKSIDFVTMEKFLTFSYCHKRV